MDFHFFKLDKLLTIRTLFSPGTTHLYMIQIFFDVKSLFAILALFGPQLTSIFMVPELSCQVTELTVLTINLLMCIRFMVVLLCFWHHFTTNFAFEVCTRAANIMDAKL